ncbi:hypothetical protein [Methylobacterium phyllostachyos]|uniref:hypothetical protein n=1 Tax=Methylobacterium phyllostachyos TaxID=582672 RepID=UPI00115F8980|nr:hypothetical protein [Methylobacterium phyllostachyos]
MIRALDGAGPSMVNAVLAGLVTPPARTALRRGLAQMVARHHEVPAAMPDLADLVRIGEAPVAQDRATFPAATVLRLDPACATSAWRILLSELIDRRISRLSAAASLLH